MTQPVDNIPIAHVDVDAEGAVLPHRPVRDDGDMDITPMIDITFLLLIFFIVASHMDANSQVELPPARHADAVTAKNAVIVTMSTGNGDVAQIYLGDGVDDNTLVRTDSPQDQEAAVTEFIDQQMHGATPKENVILKASRNVKSREVSRIARVVGSVADDVHFYVAVLDEG
ncbi:MAG: biopolymer transporter ExbD [Pirellulaceae bacterium]